MRANFTTKPRRRRRRRSCNNKIKLERQSRHLYTHRATTNKFNSKK
jgi:hypothetical protein